MRSCPVSIVIITVYCNVLELEFGSICFGGEGKTGVPGEKPLGARKRTKNKLSPHITSTPRFEQGPHWWKASALNTVSPLLLLLSLLASSEAASLCNIRHEKQNKQ